MNTVTPTEWKAYLAERHAARKGAIENALELQDTLDDVMAFLMGWIDDDKGKPPLSELKYARDMVGEVLNKSLVHYDALQLGA